MFPEIVVEKYCLVYCGPERCNCQAGRRILGIPEDIFSAAERATVGKSGAGETGDALPAA